MTKLSSELGICWKGLHGETTHRRIIGAAVTIGTLTLICQLVAVVKELWVAAWFGTSDALDAFLMAIVIPTFVINVVAGSFQSALIPAYIRVRDQEGAEAAKHLFSNVMAYSLILLLLMGVLVALVGPLILPILASGYDAEKLALTQNLLHWLLPVIVLQGTVVIWSAVLNAHHRFALAAIVPALLPVAIIVTLLTAGRHLMVFSLAIGTLAGVTGQVIMMGWGLKKQDLPLAPRWRRNNPDVQAVMGQYTPVVVAAFLMSGTNLIDQAMAAMLAPGSVSTLSYGSRLVNVGLGLSAASIATAAFPYFSQRVTVKDWAALRQTLHFYLRWIFIIAVPVSVLTFVFSEEIIRLLYERGAFSAKDTYLVAQVQSLFIWQVPFYMGGMLLARVVSSLQANRILMWASGLNLFLKVILNYLLIHWMGVSGIALSTSLMFLGSFIFVYCYVQIMLNRSRGSESQIYESD
jgi:putative peptidoglycan lipid II flippase